jgi:hypothetical protein
VEAKKPGKTESDTLNREIFNAIFVTIAVTDSKIQIKLVNRYNLFIG